MFYKTPQVYQTIFHRVSTTAKRIQRASLAILYTIDTYLELHKDGYFYNF